MLPELTRHLYVHLMHKVFHTRYFEVDFAVFVGDTHRGQYLSVRHKHGGQQIFQIIALGIRHDALGLFNHKLVVPLGNLAQQLLEGQHCQIGLFVLLANIEGFVVN